MQYNADVFTYERVKNSQNENEDKNNIERSTVIKVLLWFSFTFLISRVLLINNTAPFGIALLITLAQYMEYKINLAALIGTTLGYVSLYSNIKDMPMYIITAIMVSILSYVLNNTSNVKRAVILFISIFIQCALYKFALEHLTIDVAFLTSFLEVVCIAPVYYILGYSISCFKEIKTKHLFNNEEIISMAIMISLVISGTWGVAVQGISVRNILAFIFILVVAYVNGSAVGAAAGVAIGTIVGMSSENMYLFISIFGLCGLITGIFKDVGKWFSGISFMVTFSILLIYCNNYSDFKLLEAALSCALFLSIPERIYSKLALHLNWEIKQDNINDNYAEKIKKMFIGKLSKYSGVLYNMSEILNNLADNDKLALKGKSTSLVENLADRVCSNCNMNSMCWKREIYYTYAAFEELIQNFQEGRARVPDEIERKCIKRTLLLKNTDDIVNNYVISEMWRMRLMEGRELLSKQINNMAESVDEILDEINSNVKFNSEIEKKVRAILNKSEVKFEDITCISEKKDRLIIKVSMPACGGRQICVKDILPLINEAAGVCMCVSEDGCSIDPDTNMCNVTYEEAPKFHVASYVSRSCKEGEKVNGDSYTFGKLADGTYITLISDGMGSGPQAGRESKAVIDLIERFTQSGLSKVSAISIVNSIMTLKFSEDEKFSTVDLSSIDLYTGEVEFMKVGAAASFIKRNDRVEIINSKTLPMGVLDNVDIEINEKKVQNGDVIVMISDGILDYDEENAGKVDWVIDYLKNNSTNNPKELVEGLVAKAKELAGNKSKDDMTVIASKVYSLY
ncbi:MAG: stage II sporulation protein E [Bacillota bacterium]|nr:stage II sporulation protein E [Bacillota bacterium]